MAAISSICAQDSCQTGARPDRRPRRRGGTLSRNEPENRPLCPCQPCPPLAAPASAQRQVTTMHPIQTCISLAAALTASLTPAAGAEPTFARGGPPARFVRVPIRPEAPTASGGLFSHAGAAASTSRGSPPQRAPTRPGDPTPVRECPFSMQNSRWRPATATREADAAVAQVPSRRRPKPKSGLTSWSQQDDSETPPGPGTAITSVGKVGDLTSSSGQPRSRSSQFARA